MISTWCCNSTVHSPLCVHVSTTLCVHVSTTLCVHVSTTVQFTWYLALLSDRYRSFQIHFVSLQDYTITNNLPHCNTWWPSSKPVTDNFTVFILNFLLFNKILHLSKMWAYHKHTVSKYRYWNKANLFQHICGSACTNFYHFIWPIDWLCYTQHWLALLHTALTGSATHCIDWLCYTLHWLALLHTARLVIYCLLFLHPLDYSCLWNFRI
jgi:hypothetical protein